MFLEGIQSEECEGGNLRWVVNGPNGTGETDVCNDLGRFVASESGVYEVVVRGASDRGVGSYRFEVIEGVSHWIPDLAADVMSSLLVDHISSYTER